MDPWADDRVRCKDCRHYGPVSKWHPSRDEDGNHKRVTLDGCLIDRAHIDGEKMRRCPFQAFEPKSLLPQGPDFSSRHSSLKN